MKVNLINITSNIEDTIVEIARVSSSRKDKKAEGDRLLKYLIKNKHWSPFEHGYLTFEIETSKAIAIQLLRHRSFTFQELSQRYANVSKGFDDDMFENIELRKQADGNRQSSTEVFEPEIFHRRFAVEREDGSFIIKKYLESCQLLYKQLLKEGVARECARMILPMATKTRLYMTGNVRSWIHFLELRDDENAQKEIQLIAKEIKKTFIKELPIISKALNYD